MIKAQINESLDVIKIQINVCLDEIKAHVLLLKAIVLIWNFIF